MTPYPLSKTETSTKVLISLFLLTMAVSISVAELNVKDKVKFTSDGVVARYGPEKEPLPAAVGQQADVTGEPVQFGADGSATPSTGPESGPQLEEEPLVARMNTFTLLLDVTHPHVFELPLVIFVLAHFLMRTRIGTPLKLVTYALSFGGIMAFLGAPWMVRYVSIGWAPLMLFGALMIGATSMVMIAVPLWDMWTPPNRSPQNRSTQNRSR